MRKIFRAAAYTMVLLVQFAWQANETSGYVLSGDGNHTVVISTDMGLDDVVTLAMAFQNPDVNIAAVMPSEGVCSSEKSMEYLCRLRAEFNRSDIAVIAAGDSSAEKQAPVFRPFAQKSVGNLINISTDIANTVAIEDGSWNKKYSDITILAIGPVSDIVKAFDIHPSLKARVSEIIIAGGPDPKENWNLRFDVHAYEKLKGSGVNLSYVDTVAKPEGWVNDKFPDDSGVTIGERLFARLAGNSDIAGHYLSRLAFFDEVAFLTLSYPDLFEYDSKASYYKLKYPEYVDDAATELLSKGRQKKRKVVFVDAVISQMFLQDDIKSRYFDIIDKNGEDEFFAQLIMNELHEHLGAYSIIGVKMGMYAMELLNAPQHGMQIVSHIGSEPPVSCLNDGLMVATGCTVGRGLFKQSDIDNEKVRVTFTYNSKSVTLELKPEYRQKVKERIGSILAECSLEDGEYWTRVREFGVDVWTNWHRSKLFDVAGDN